MKENPIRTKSYAFALEIIRTCKKLDAMREYVVSRQLLRSGTSIGTNVEEAIQAQSKPDFIAKLSISLKEACETQYWLRLTIDSAIGDAQEMRELYSHAQEITRMLTAILKTSRQRTYNR